MTEITNNQKLHFFIEDLRMKVDSLNTHFSRMWLRFNFFLTIEAGLFALAVRPPVGTQLFQNFQLYLPIGIGLAFIWYIIGSQDRYHLATQRNLIKDVAKQIKEELKLKEYIFPVQTDDIPERLWPKCRFYQWRIESISVTRAPAYLPCVAIFAWVSMWLIFNHSC